MSDWQHNIMAVVDGTGSVQERYTYDAFGTAQVRQADWTLSAVSALWAHSSFYAGSTVDWTILSHSQTYDLLTGGYQAGGAIFTWRVLGATWRSRR